MNDGEYVAAIDYGAHRDGFDELQQQIAARHHVLLSPDDPIAMLQTLNEILVEKTATALEQAQVAALAKFARELELATAASQRAAQELVARALEVARHISTEQIERATRGFVDVLAREREHTRTTVRRAAVLNTIVLIALALGVAGSLWLR